MAAEEEIAKLRVNQYVGVDDVPERADETHGLVVVISVLLRQLR